MSRMSPIEENLKLFQYKNSKLRGISPERKERKVNSFKKKMEIEKNERPDLFGVVPNQCFTCGNKIGHYQGALEEWLDEGGDLKGFYSFYGVPEEQRERLDHFLSISFKVREQVKELNDYLANNEELLNTFIATHPRFKWSRKGDDDSKKWTLKERVKKWINGDEETLEAIKAYTKWTLDGGYLNDILVKMDIKQKYVPEIVLRAVFGNNADGFQRLHKIKGFLPCCKINLRPPPKIFTD